MSLNFFLALLERWLLLTYPLSSSAVTGVERVTELKPRRKRREQALLKF